MSLDDKVVTTTALQFTVDRLMEKVPRLTVTDDFTSWQLMMERTLALLSRIPQTRWEADPEAAILMQGLFYHKIGVTQIVNEVEKSLRQLDSVTPDHLLTVIKGCNERTGKPKS